MTKIIIAQRVNSVMDSDRSFLLTVEVHMTGTLLRTSRQRSIYRELFESPE